MPFARARVNLEVGCHTELWRSVLQNKANFAPSKMFAKADREPSLWLPTHEQCNQNRSAEDEVIAQLIGTLHGRPITEQGRKPRFAAGTFPDGTLGLGAAIQLRPIIFRWVCGFHAALYDA